MKVYLEEIEDKVVRFLKEGSEDVLDIPIDDIEGELVVGKWYVLTEDNTVILDNEESGKRLSKAEAIRKRLKNE